VGDVAETVNEFRATLTPEAPLGFVSVDLDLYSSTVNALALMRGDPELYLPAVSMYFDDVAFYFANRWCGELAAIHEFNGLGGERKIDHDRSLPGPRRPRDWHRRMFVCHILDHQVRRQTRRRRELSIDAHASFMRGHHLF
jgi:hypothetical protein